ncbi:MAG: ATPase F0F1 [Nitrospirae bacterium CG_4_10_14_0_8_um_filter_41_23]|nr:MAG: ATPase F0F1 [Nitrospirae bacterium CG_4_10_14_0_8_um_filter_41_23]
MLKFTYQGKDMSEKSLFKQLYHVSTIGFTIVISTFVGLAMGYGLDYAMDKWIGIHTKPWLTIIFLILGIIAGFRELYRMATKPEKK